MEQETFIPGMNAANAGVNPYNPVSQAYKPDSTMIEGMPFGNPTASSPNSQSPTIAMGANNQQSSSTPVVGFLYSVSRNGFPEYWPLYVGQNSVGKSVDSDIVLREASVSDHHADIQIKKMRQQGGKLIATIVDAGSKNGIVVNDEELDYDRHPLNNGDILTIGLHYKCVFILIDPVVLGISPVEGFVALEQPTVSQPMTEKVLPDTNMTQHPGQPNPYSSPYEGYNARQDETINISGPSYSGLDAGGTKIL